jgi:hypothetical protein
MADHRRLLTTMDPALKEYLDSLKGNMASIKQSMDTRLDAIMGKQDYMAQQFELQASSLSDLCGWKPELEARFSRLQAVVKDLQCAQPASATIASGFAAAPLGAAAPCNNKGAFHGQFGLGDNSTPEALRRWPSCHRWCLRSRVCSLSNTP